MRLPRPFLFLPSFPRLRWSQAATDLGLFHLGLIALALFLYNPWIVHQRIIFMKWHHATSWGLIAVLVGALCLQHRETFAGLRRTPSFLRRIYIAMGLFGAWASLSALVGVANGNPLLSVVADLSQVLTWVVSFWLAGQVIALYGGAHKVLGAISVGYLVTMAWEIATYVIVVLEMPFDLDLNLVTVRLGDLRIARSLSTVPPAVLPVVAAYLLIPNPKTEGRGTVPVTVTLYAAAVVAASSVVITFGRTIWATSAISLLLVVSWTLMRYGRALFPKILYQGAAVCLITVIVLNVVSYEGESLATMTVNRVAYTEQQLKDETNIGLRSRLSEYDVIAAVAREQPFLGRGLGAHYEGLERGELKRKHFFHNSYGALVFRMGLPGLALFLLAALSITLSLAIRSWRVYSPLDFALLTGSLGALSSYGLQAVAYGNFFAHPIPIVLGLLLGLSVAPGRCASPNSDQIRGPEEVNR